MIQTKRRDAIQLNTHSHVEMCIITKETQNLQPKLSFQPKHRASEHDSNKEQKSTVELSHSIPPAKKPMYLRKTHTFPRENPSIFATEIPAVLIALLNKLGRVMMNLITAWSRQLLIRPNNFLSGGLSSVPEKCRKNTRMY